MDNSNRFYDELIVEQNNIMNHLKNSKDEKEQRNFEKHLTIINILIKNIYKYNNYKNPKTKK
jgi:2'-5' RNA ligase